MLRVGLNKELDSTHDTRLEIFCIKKIKTLTLMYIYHFSGFLRLKSWAFASMLRLGICDLTSTPCELAPKCS